MYIAYDTLCKGRGCRVEFAAANVLGMLFRCRISALCYVAFAPRGPG